MCLRERNFIFLLMALRITVICTKEEAKAQNIIIITQAKIFFTTREAPEEDLIAEEEEAEVLSSSLLPRQIQKSNIPTKAARLPHFSQAWQQVTSNSLILNIVCNGYKIQFISTPFQSDFTPRNMSKKNTKICKFKVKEFLEFKIIKIVTPSHDQFLSHIFPVPKKLLGEYRIIFDLTELNQFVRKIKFKMDKIQDIMLLIQPGDFFVSIDLSDAYYCIAIHILSIPFLTFYFLNILYQFTCLPQGLSSAPRIFTKVMRVVLTFLRHQNIRISAWIDDFLLAASSFSSCQDHAFKTLSTFEELGFVPNYEKSQLTPSQKICHLGLIWDSVDFSVSVPEDKIATVKRKCMVALSSRVKVCFLMSILGSIEYFRWGFPHAALHYRRLQRFVNSCLARDLDFDHYVSASKNACIDLLWWSKVGDSLPARSLSPFESSLELFCDASQTGWGCWSSDDKETFGFWSYLEKKLHINILESKAVLFAFRCFFRFSFNLSILIHTDSATVVAYINKQGGTTSARLCDMALELWEFCIKRNISISAVHVPGIKNTKADYLSRLEDNDHSYSLSNKFFTKLCGAINFPLTIDCFASRLNCKIENFISRYPDPFSSCIDAFTVKWSNNVYLFPPVPIIPRVISKFVSDKTAHGLLICPYWPSQHWFPSLLELLIAPPILIPSEMVQDESGRLPRNCQLVAWSIGCSHVELMAYQNGLESVLSGASKGKHLSTTKDVSENSVLGLINGRMITVKSL